jgi:hypothetical protein
LRVAVTGNRRDERAPSYEVRKRRLDIAAYVIALAFLVITGTLCVRFYGPAIGLVVWAPAPAALTAWWLLHRGAGLRYWLKWFVLRKLQGRFYAFDDVHVRMEPHGEAWRVCAADIFAVLDLPLDLTTVRRLALRLGDAGFFADEQGEWWFADRALLAWLRGRGPAPDRLALRLARWLEREALPGRARGS